jgi:hypothetical protein
MLVIILLRNDYFLKYIFKKIYWYNIFFNFLKLIFCVTTSI